MQTDSEKKAAEHDAKAAQHYRDREDSFARCDTDGFLSQWASGLCGSLERERARLARAGGQDTFLGLFKREGGARVAAKLIDGKWGKCWAFCDEAGKFTGKFLSHSKGTPRSKMFREGYETRKELASAVAEITGQGTGLSGTAWVAVFRTDEGYPADAVVVE